MRSSMTPWPGSGVERQSEIVSPANTALGSRVSSCRARPDGAALADGPRHVLNPQVLVEARNPGHALGQRTLSLQPRRDAAVGQLGVVVHGGAIDLGGADGARRVDDHLHHHRLTVLALVQGREVGGEPLRQHREDAGRGVDAGGVLRGVAGRWPAPRREGVDISNGHPEPARPVGQGLRHRELVEVGCRLCRSSKREARRSRTDGGAGGGTVDRVELRDRGGGNSGQASSSMAWLAMSCRIPRAARPCHSCALPDPSGSTMDRAAASGCYLPCLGRHLALVVSFVSTCAGGRFALKFRDRLHLILGFTAGVVTRRGRLRSCCRGFALRGGAQAGPLLPMVGAGSGFLLFHAVEKLALIQQPRSRATRTTTRRSA